MSDPRPFNYEYRRPRPDNRTYQSYNAFESLYHNGRVDRPSVPSQLMRDEHAHRYDLYSQKMPNPYLGNSRHSQYQPAPKQYEDTGINTDRISSRAGSNYSRRSKSSFSSNSNQPIPPPSKASILSTYGSTSLKGNEGQQSLREQQISVSMNRDYTSQIFAKQQKPFDIINCYSKPAEPLKIYPKYTLQNIYFERGLNPRK